MLNPACEEDVLPTLEVELLWPLPYPVMQHQAFDENYADDGEYLYNYNHNLNDGYRNKHHRQHSHHHL